MKFVQPLYQWLFALVLAAPLGGEDPAEPWVAFDPASSPSTVQLAQSLDDDLTSAPSAPAPEYPAAVAPRRSDGLSLTVLATDPLHTPGPAVVSAYRAQAPPEAARS